MHAALSSVPTHLRGLLAFLVIAGGTWTQIDAQQSVRDIIRDPNQSAACVVTIPVSNSAKSANDRLTIDIRVPGQPASAFLGKVPVEKRDFTVLPIRVLLVPTPRKDSGPALTSVKPLSADFTPRRLGLNANPAEDTFVRVEYLRADLQGGVDVVAERSAPAGAGEKVTSQTRCRIGGVDAILWK